MILIKKGKALRVEDPKQIRVYKELGYIEYKTSKAKVAKKNDKEETKIPKDETPVLVDELAELDNIAVDEIKE